MDYEETFAHVARFSSIRALLAIGAHYDLEIHQMDVDAAYLNDDIDYDIYMKQPEGSYVNESEHLVCKLNKSLYGLKQSGRVWYEKITDELKSLGFHQLLTENCVFITTHGENSLTIIALYVDDLLLQSNSLKTLNNVKQKLSTIISMKDVGEAKYILGLEIYRNRLNKTISITQHRYITKIIELNGLINASDKTSKPMNTGVKLVKNRTP